MVLEQETLDSLNEIKYLLELMVSKDGSYKDKMNEDSKTELQSKLFSTEK